jgi:hypothetical protein
MLTGYERLIGEQDEYGVGNFRGAADAGAERPADAIGVLLIYNHEPLEWRAGLCDFPPVVARYQHGIRPTNGLGGTYGTADERLPGILCQLLG